MATDADQPAPLAWRDLAAGRLDDLLHAAAQCDPTRPAEVMRLRKQWDAAQVHAALELTVARRRGEAKFGGRAATLLTDRVGMEQATSRHVARYKAQRFTRLLGQHARVLDLCCGIGGDLMGLRDAGLHATGIDSDPLHALMAAHNAGCGVATQHIDSDWQPPESIDAIHIDPDRRPGGTRTLDPHAFNPPLTVLEALRQRCPALVVKLAPGTDAGDLPFDAQLEYISDAGTLVQAVAWCGPLADPHDAATVATRIDAAGQAHTFNGKPLEQTANDCGPYLFTADPSVERAGLLGTLAESLDAQTLWPGVGLLTADQPLGHPMLRGYRLLEELPWRESKARDALHAHGAGIVTVKTRDKAVDPDRVAPRLRGPGERALTLFVLRFGEPVRALIAEPI